MKCIAALVLIAVQSVAQPLNFPATASRYPSSGSLLLSWTYGMNPSNTLWNVTRSEPIETGIFNTYMVSGLPIGSTNAFVVANEYGMSNIATGVAKPFELKASIRPYIYLVEVPSKTNGTTRILTSTNLRIWSTYRTVTSGPTYQFLWTNNGGARFFHSVSP